MRLFVIGSANRASNQKETIMSVIIKAIHRQSAEAATATHYRSDKMDVSGQIEEGLWWPVTRSSDVPGLRWPAVVRLRNGTECRIA